MTDKKEYVAEKMEALRTIFKRHDNNYLKDELGVTIHCIRQFKNGSQDSKKVNATQNLSLGNYHKAKALFLDNAGNDIRKLR